MIEIFIVVLGTVAIADAARRRGGSPWLFGVIAVIGYLVVGTAASQGLGQGANLVGGVLWLGLLYGAVFLLVGKGKTARNTWYCPECRFFNEPSTLVCACGYRATDKDLGVA